MGIRTIDVEEEGITVFVILGGSENLCAPIPSGDDVKKSFSKMDPRFPCLDRFLSNIKSCVNAYLLMPAPLPQSICSHPRVVFLQYGRCIGSNSASQMIAARRSSAILEANRE